jgi:hypothetical protein
MAYVPDWERLSDALSRVVAAGLSKPEAQRDICRAIVDRKIRIRLQAAKAEIPDAKWFGPAVGSHVAIPQDLSPRDFDWRKSLPKRPWQHGDHPFVQVHLSLIELFSADVTLLLCAGSRVPATKGNSRARTQRSRDKNPLGHQETQDSIADPTFDPSEWITLSQAAQILRLERDSSDGSSQLRLIELLRRKPGVARVAIAPLSPLANNKIVRSGLMPLPNRCLWVDVDEIDWATSTVRAFPLLSGTDKEDWYSQDQTLGIRVNHAAVVDMAQQERDADARSRALKHEVATRLFGELFWPAPRVVAWIAFRNPQMIEASVRAARLYDNSGRALKDRDPQGALLRALQQGSLQALRDGSALPREIWATATGRSWPDDVRFRREDVLALWAPERDLHPQTQAPARPGASPILANLPFDPPDILKQARVWRANRIERFIVRQRRVREWINFAEIAEWCSKEDGSIVPNEQKRAAAFDTLQGDLLAGEFDENGRSRALYLHPATVKARMTRELLKEAIDHDYDGQNGRAQYLPFCWIPRTLFTRWLLKHRLTEAPPRFEPRQSDGQSRNAVTIKEEAVDKAIDWVDPDHKRSDRLSAGNRGAFTRPKAFASDETAAAKALAVFLKDHPQLKRADAVEWSRNEGFVLTHRGFQYRVWPRARELANLPPRASPGRKRKP